MDHLRDGDPARVGEYRLIVRLGLGGMGRVFLGRSARGRMVAVKLVHPELARDPEFRRRFRSEVAAARKVGGEWTAPVLAADTESDTPWVATGYVAGPNLAQAVESYGPLPADSVLALAAGLARALRAVHGAGLVHRDLKPSNVLVTIDGPRVIDFGIARSVDGTVSTRTGVLVGSPGYMSPEQVRGETVTAASDIFSLGSVLAFAATGRQPFGGGSDDSGVHAQLFRVASQDPDLGELTGPVRDLVERCLAKEVGERPDLDGILALASPEAGQEPGAWLPTGVVAELGRHATRMLDLEDPADFALPAPGTFTPATPPPAASPVPPPAPPPPGAQRPTPPPMPPGGPGGTAVYPYSQPQQAASRSRTPVYLAAGAVAILAITLAGTLVALAGGEDDKARKPGDSAGATGATAWPTNPSGPIPATLLGSWAGTGKIAPTSSTETIRRFTLSQGEVGAQVGTIREVDDDELCEYAANLVSAGEQVQLRTSLTKGFPSGKCESGDTHSMSANPDGTVMWSSGSETLTLRRPQNAQIPQQHRGRWWGVTKRPGSSNSEARREFDLGAGEVGTETVTIKMTTDTVACEASAVLVSAEGAVEFFSTRVTKQIRGKCTVGTLQILSPTHTDNMIWRGGTDTKETGTLQRS